VLGWGDRCIVVSDVLINTGGQGIKMIYFQRKRERSGAPVHKMKRLDKAWQ